MTTLQPKFLNRRKRIALWLVEAEYIDKVDVK